MNAPLTPTEATTLPSPVSGGGEVAFLSMIERAARDPEIDVDKLDRLLLMRERENARVVEQAFNAALADAQTEMRPVATDSDNPQTRSRYASYAALDRAVRPIYTRHGFALSFNTADAPGTEQARILCDVCHAGGHTRRYHIDMPIDGKGARGGDVMTKAHAMGSGISYGMRYLLRMIFNMAIDYDDDGNAAGGRHISRARHGTVQPKQDAAPVFNRLRGELDAITSLGDLHEWGDTNGVTIATFAADWQKALRLRFSEKLAELRPTSAVPERPSAPATAKVPARIQRNLDRLNPKPGGIAERAMAARWSAGPSQTLRVTKDGVQRLPPLNVDMNDELPGDLGPPKLDHSERDGVPRFLDRRPANGAAEATFVDLVEGGL